MPDDTSGLSHVLSGRGLDDAANRLEKLRLALEEDASERNIARFSDAQEQFENAGGYAAEAEVHRLVDGLGLQPDRLDLTIGALSGGERRRLELARILFGGSDLLLLDEPTNHLDADARDWLLRFLRGYRGALVVISHDLDLLDEAITRVIHLDREEEEAVGEIVEYKGTYSQYVKARAPTRSGWPRWPSNSASRSNGSRCWPTRSAARPPSGPVWPRRSTAASAGSRPTESTDPPHGAPSTCASPNHRPPGAPRSPPAGCGRDSVRPTSSPT